MNAHKNNENGEAFEISAQIWLMVNNLPTVTDVNYAGCRCITVLKFDSTFTDDPTKVDHTKRIYLKDPRLRNRKKELVPYFMTILLEFNKKFRSEDLEKPQCAVDEAVPLNKHTS